jgi:glycosyltransferase involved in cell wall biosynthesis
LLLITKMKIAYLSTFYPFRGGIAQYNAALYRQFEKDHTIRSYTFTRQYPNILFPGKSQYVESGDIADKIDSIPVLDSINPFNWGGAARKIMEFNPDMLLMKFWMPFFGPSLTSVAKKLKMNGIKIISILDNVIPHEKRPGDIFFTGRFLNANDGFIAMSNTVKNDLLKLKPGAVFNFHAHPLYDHFGAKLDKAIARQTLGIPDDKKVLLFFGFIRGYKGLDVLLRALKLLDDSYIVLIAGEVYGSFDEYDKIIAENNIGDRVIRHVKYIGDNEVPAYFSASDVCVLPYKSATQSGIIGITYHFDLPVIATDTGSLREMVGPYDAGIIIDRAEPEMLAQAVIKYFSENLYQLFSSNIGRYKSENNWQTLAKSILELYWKVGG